MHDAIFVLAGDCTATTADGEEHRGDVLVVVKPDNTVLVHDRTGYQPVAWLTRAASVSVDGDTVDARDGDRRLRVVCHAEHGRGRYPGSDAGDPVADCPDCEGTLVRAGGSLTCTGCGERYGLPADADVTGGRCADCGLPTIRVERGQAFEVCVDRECEPLDARVREAFDGAWACPDCGEALEILRRGGLIAGCSAYPACDTGFGFPRGVVTDTCACGLPVFETDAGRRCLDSDCDHVAPDRPEPTGA